MAQINTPHVSCDYIGQAQRMQPDLELLLVAGVVLFLPLLLVVLRVGSGSKNCTQNGNPGKWKHGLNPWSHCDLILTHTVPICTSSASQVEQADGMAVAAAVGCLFGVGDPWCPIRQRHKNGT